VPPGGCAPATLGRACRSGSRHAPVSPVSMEHWRHLILKDLTSRGLKQCWTSFWKSIWGPLHSEGRTSARPRKPGQLRLPAGARQEQEKQIDENHVVVDSRRRRASARSRRTKAATAQVRIFGASVRIFGRRDVAISGLEEPSGVAVGLFLLACPQLRSKKESSPTPFRFPL
jgi:hypothetical protein